MEHPVIVLHSAFCNAFLLMDQFLMRRMQNRFIANLLIQIIKILKMEMAKTARKND